MKNNKKNLGIKLLAIAGISIIASVGIFASNEKILQSASAQNAITHGITSPQVATIQWPPAGWWTNGQQHMPLQTTVVIGVNNTVKWVNGGQRMEWISANNMSDPDFAKAAPVFASLSDLPSGYKIQKTVAIAPEKVEVFYTAPDTAGQEKSFITMPMKLADNVINPEKSFEYTFTHAGTFGYHSRAWERGYITVLEKGVRSQ